MKNPEYVQSALNYAAGLGNDTVVVITNSECPTCSQFNRHLYSISGTSASYPSIPTQLIAEGGFCPNCTVQVLPYVEGMTLPPEFPMQVQQQVQTSQSSSSQESYQALDTNGLRGTSVGSSFQVATLSLGLKPTFILAMALALAGIIITFLPWINLGMRGAGDYAIGAMALIDIPDDVSLFEVPRVVERFVEMASALDIGHYDLERTSAVLTVIRIATWAMIGSLVLGIVLAFALDNHPAALLVIGFILLAVISIAFISMFFEVGSSSITLRPTAYIGAGLGVAGLILTIIGSGRAVQ